jgi:branched-chain amino acid transport system permease protein
VRGIWIKDRTRIIVLAVLVVLLLMATQGMSAQDWVITLLRGLSVAAVTFLVASGFSLIFGLMDVLNLAHGMLFMLGAYVGWTVYTRPDTAVDVVTPLAWLIAGFMLMPLWDNLLGRISLPHRVTRLLPWLGLLVAVVILALSLSRYPIAMWDPNIYNQSPVVYSLMLDQGQLKMPEPVPASATALALGLGGALIGSTLAAASLAGLRHREASGPTTGRWQWSTLVVPLVLVVIGLGVYAINEPLTAALFNLDTTWRFLLAIIIATLAGAGLGGLMESTLIRPLYARPIYQLMLTLGLGVIGREVVVALWGRTQITMSAPTLFAGSGKGCPAISVSDWLVKQCSTISFMGARVRTYNEILVILVGVLVLIVIGLLIQRSRLGMIIRAGVQDREMVEALGINVRRVFTLIFAVGVGLAALGGVIAGPAMGLSDDMGESLLLLALIALAIGGLTSFPGAAVGSVLVGVLQQFIIKYGQIGIQLPFLPQPFKPTPPLVPASTVLLMVIILLVMPQGLFGRKE